MGSRFIINGKTLEVAWRQRMVRPSLNYAAHPTATVGLVQTPVLGGTLGITIAYLDGGRVQVT